MGFWPFGREPSEVEIASRVVTAPTRDRFTVRGKLTLHFLEPQTQAAADGAADRCVELCAAILREAPDHRSLISGEATVVSELVARLPPDFAPTRAIELVSLHVVGDAGPSAAIRRPSSGAMAAVKMPGPTIASAPPNATLGRDARPPGETLGRGARPPGETSGRDARPPGDTSLPIPAGRVPTPPPAATSSPIPRPRRASSTRMRAVSIMIPPGSPPPAMGAAVVPLVRDSAARLLVGTLRAYDLLVLRRVTLDESSPEMLSALVPISEVAPGAFESSRAQELSRWQGMLGPQIFAQLQRDASVFAVYLAYAAMIAAMVPQPLAAQVLEATCTHGFPSEASPLPEAERWLSAVDPSTVSELAASMIRNLGQQDQIWALSRALAPLIDAVQEDMSFAATLVRHAATS